MIICKLCNKELKNSLALPGHLRHNHSSYKVRAYYDEFYKKNDLEGHCKICGKPTSFESFEKGYRIYCCSKCSQNSEDVRNKVLKAVIKYDDNFKKTGFCDEKPHVYRYDFEYNGNIYHYVGSTIHSQVSRVRNGYNSFMPDVIKQYGYKDFLLKFCTIVEWFDDVKEMKKFEELLNKKVKAEYGEEFVLSINDGNMPSNRCLLAAVETQRRNGSWNKGTHLSTEHKTNISKGISKANIYKGQIQMIDCINRYLENQTNEKLNYRIKRYIKNHYDRYFVLTVDNISPYLEIIQNDLLRMQ